LCLDGLWTYEHANNQDVNVEARSEGWYWAAPLPGHAVRVMAFIDPDWLRRQQVRRVNLDGFYCNLLLKTDILNALKGPSLKGNVIARDATCYFDDAPIDESFIKVGEAAFAIDPLSSSGVQKALQTAKHDSWLRRCSSRDRLLFGQSTTLRSATRGLGRPPLS
jgi:hypothetical protein